MPARNRGRSAAYLALFLFALLSFLPLHHADAQSAPSVQLEPYSPPWAPTHVTSATYTITILTCSDTWVQPPYAVVNGGYTYDAREGPTPPSCGRETAAWLVDVTLTPGLNTVVVTACAGSACTDATTQVVYDPPPVYGLVVTPDAQAVSVASGARSQVFSVQNTGNQVAAVTISASCTGGMSACVASPTSLSLSPNQSSAVTVTYTAGAPGSTGDVQLSATQTNGSAQDNGSINVTVPSYGLAVTPDAQSISVLSGGQSQIFSVQNTGNQVAAVTISVSCTGGMSACVASPASLSLSPNQSGAVTVTYTAGAPGTTGAVQLSATQTNGSAQDNGSIDVTVTSYGISVTPDAQAITVPSGAQSQLFSVQNTGNQVAAVTVSASCGGGMSACAVSPTSLSLSPNQSSAVTVTYTAGAPGSTGTVQLSATQTNGSAQDNGSVDVTVPIYGLSVTPDAQATTVPSGGQSQVFSVQNTGNQVAAVTISASCTGGMSACAASPTSLSLSPNQSSSVTVTYTAGAPGSTGAVQLSATQTNGSAQDNGSINVTVPSYGLSVTPDAQAITVPSGGQSQAFSVQNTGNQLAAVTISASCTGGMSGCAASPTSLTLSPNQSGTVTVTYTAGAPGTTGAVQLSATQTNGSAQDNGSINVTVPAYALSVTPDAQAISIPSGGQSQVFSVQNTGNQMAAVTVSASCTGGMTACAASPTSLSLSPNQISSVAVTYTAGPPGSTGVVQLSATQTNGSAQDNGSINVTVPAGAPTVQLEPSLPGAPAHVNSPTYTITILTCSDTWVEPPYAVVNGGATFDALEGGTPPTCGFPRPQGAAWNVDVTLSPGLNTVVVTACAGTACTNSTTQVVYDIPHELSPDGANRSAEAGKRSVQAFTFANRTSSPLQVGLVAACSGAIDAVCTPSASRLYLRANDSSQVTVSYVAQPVAGAGTVVLRALSLSGSILDTGYVNVSVTAPSLAIVDVAPSTAGVTIAKDQCVTFSLRAETAAECGVLRVAHEVPGVRTRNTARTPTLLYYYDLASRSTTIGVDVTMAPTATYEAGDSVRVAVQKLVNGQCISPESKTYSAAHWFTGNPGAKSRRVGVNVALETSGSSYIRQYCVEATLLRSSGPVPLAPVQYGEFAVVQRYDSPFGSGWWLAGLEELFLNQPDSIGGANNAILWVGGDASTRRYRCRSSTCDGVYLPDVKVDQVDSLVLSGGEYTRYLPHGLKVVFDVTGRHLRTVNRQGAVTTFAYSGSTRQLLSVTVPPASASLSFNFEYDGAGQLMRVNAPGETSGTVRSLTVQHSGAAVTGFVDPDNKGISFSPPSSDPSNLRLIGSVVDRRGTATFYDQERGSPTVAHVSTSLGGGRTQEQWLRTAGSLSAASTASQSVPDSVGEAFLRVTDGNGNVTRIWQDQLGAPIKIVDAVGRATIVRRGDPRFAGLATEVVQPNGHTVAASYDDHGNIVAQYDVNPFANGQDAITRYHWNLQWDFADSVVTPTNLATTFGYETQTGNRLWQQTGPDASRRVNFAYYAGGAADKLLKSTVLPGTPADTVYYDALANPSGYRTPLGYLTQYFNDAIGRTYQTWQQVSVSAPDSTSRTVVQYDIMSRDTMTITNSSDPAQATVGVRRTLDAAGADSIITRWTTSDALGIGNMVTHTYRDALGRAVKEVAPDGFADSTIYDGAGNVATIINRNGDVVTFAYDSLNRLRRRATAQKQFNPEYIGLSRARLLSSDPVEAAPALSGQGLSQPYPWDRPSGYTIPAQVDTFIYHPTDGTLTDANNAFAAVHFDYYPNGQLRAEQNSQAPWDGGAGSWHTYRDSIEYDLNGRRLTLGYPGIIGGGSVGYSYSPSGNLSTVDAFSQHTSFEVDERGQLKRRNLPNASSQAFTYDHDGNLASDTVMLAGDYWRRQRYTYDARGSRTRMTDVAPDGTLAEADTNRYNLLGQLTSSTTSVFMVGAFSHSNTYNLDGFGNMIYRSGAEASRGWSDGYITTTTSSNNGEEWNFYKPGTGRLWYTKTVADPDTTGQNPGGGGKPAAINWYDNAGNLTWTGAAILGFTQDNKIDGQSERRMYYGADGKLRAVDARSVFRTPTQPSTADAGGFSHAFEEYRYDALGRRVATRFDQECDYNIEFNLYNGPCHVSGIRRTIWDGSQELGEIQLPAEHIEDDAYVGQGSASINLAPYYGAVAYAYDGKIDQPLLVKRLRYANLTPSHTIEEVPAFVYFPFWDVHGVVPFISWGSGAAPNSVCPSTQLGGELATCVSLVVRKDWLPYRDASIIWAGSWWGSLLQDKADASGLLYRRNRYYDSKSGRFTQEDPIGLAGGLNLYGFADGDPVNFSDPFGLCKDANGVERGGDFCPGGQGLKSAGLLDPIAWLSGGIAAGIERGLAALGTRAAASAGARVAANKIAGDAFRDEIADAFESNGYGVAKEVGKKTPFGRRVIDVEVSKNGEVLGGIEAKAGKSRYLPWQMAKDEYLRRTGYPVQVVRDATAVKVSGIPK